MIYPFYFSNFAMGCSSRFNPPFNRVRVFCLTGSNQSSFFHQHCTSTVCRVVLYRIGKSFLHLSCDPAYWSTKVKSRLRSERDVTGRVSFSGSAFLRGKFEWGNSYQPAEKGSTSGWGSDCKTSYLFTISKLSWTLSFAGKFTAPWNPWLL